MSLVKGLARPVPDFAKLHALEEQRVARWKRQHKKELTVPKGFKLNPAPPNGPPNKQGAGIALDNEWLSDREREREREERLANAVTAEHHQYHAANESTLPPSTAAMRRPPELPGRPYSAKPAASGQREQNTNSPYNTTRTGANPQAVTVQAYANTMANRSPSRTASNSIDALSRSGSTSSSKFVSKVKDATMAGADEQQQQRIGAPSAQMLYPPAFKGGRSYGNPVPPEQSIAPGGPRGSAQVAALPPRALPQHHDDSKENQQRPTSHADRERELEVRSRPTSHYSRPGTAARDRDSGGAVPPPWEVPQVRIKGMALNEMVIGSGSGRGGAGSMHKADTQRDRGSDRGGERGNQLSPAAQEGLRFVSSSSSEASRAPTATLHERVELGPTTQSNKGMEGPTCAVKRLPDARPSTAGRRRFNEVDSPSLDGRSSSASGMHGGIAPNSLAGRDSLLPHSAADHTLTRGPSSPVHGHDRDVRPPGWAKAAVPTIPTAPNHHHQQQQQQQQAEVRMHAVSQPPHMPQPQARAHPPHEQAARDARQAPREREKASEHPPQAPEPPTGSLSGGSVFGPVVKGAEVSSRPVKDMSNEELQALIQTITALHLKRLEQPFSSCDFYTMSKTLGEGAYGKVKLGVHRITGEKVAVKTFEKSKLTEVQAQKRVAREVRILKALIHPHIIRLFEIVDEPYRRLLVMEYSSGGDLCRYVRDNRRLNESEAARLFVQIVDGLTYCHACGIVHRDVKLDNLLLDDQRNIRIVDFGFSVSYQKGQKLRKACGSPSYAAPEIVARRPYAPAGVDVWSLGVVLYAMVCGYFPFQGSNNQDLCRKIVKGRFECPSFMSAECRDLVRMMLNVDPLKRISLEDCARHIWARSAYAKKAFIDPKEAPVHTMDCEVSMDSVHGQLGAEPDVDLVDKVTALGFQKTYIQQCVKNNRHNLCNTTYYLLQQRKNKEKGRTHAMLGGQ